MEQVKVKITHIKGFVDGFSVYARSENGTTSTTIGMSSPFKTREDAVKGAQRLIRDWRTEKMAHAFAAEDGLIFWGPVPEKYVSYAKAAMKFVPDWEEPKEQDFEYAPVLVNTKDKAVITKLDGRLTMWSDRDKAEFDQTNLNGHLKATTEIAETHTFDNCEWVLARRLKAGEVEVLWK